MAADIQKIITDAADKYGVPVEALMAIASIESSFNPLAKNPRSSAAGLFQFINSTAKGMGLADPYDPVASADAAARMAATNIKSLRKTLGREPTTGELYLAHQQGLGGARALLANPNESALTALTRVYGGNKNRAMAALVQSGGNISMTAGEFADKWTSKGDAAVGRLPGDSSSRVGAAYTSSREGVQRLQSELKRMGFDPGEVDGVMGPRTKSAIRKFQDANGLPADGIVGPRTINALSAMGGGNVSVPGSQNPRNVSGVAPAGVSISPGYNPNIGIGDSGNAAMSVTPRVPTANFRDPADRTLNNISPEQVKELSRGLDMNVSREQSAKDVLISGFGALLGKAFPMGSASASGANVSQFYNGILPAPASGALTSVSRPTYTVDSSGNIVDRTTGAKVGQSEPSFVNAGLSALRRQIGITDASYVGPTVPAAAPKPRPATPVATPYLPGMTLPRPASFPVTTKTVRTDGTVVSGVGGAGQVGTGKLPEDYSPNRQPKPATTTPKVVYSGDPSIGNIYVYPKVPYTEGDPNRLKPQQAGLPLNTNPAPPKLTGFGGMTGTSFPSLAASPVKVAAAPIPLPRNARPVAPASTALAATAQLAGVKPATSALIYSGGSSSGGGSSSRSGSSSPAPIKGSATGTLYNVGQTYTTGGGLKYVAQADGTFKKV